MRSRAISLRPVNGQRVGICIAMEVYKLPLRIGRKRVDVARHVSLLSTYVVCGIVPVITYSFVTRGSVVCKQFGGVCSVVVM